MREFFALALAVLPMSTNAEIVIQPRTEAQAEALRSTDSEVLYSGRKFAGKSVVVILKAWLYCEAYPGGRALVAREERASMDNTTLEVAREIIPGALWAACWREKDSRLKFPNGSHIDFRGLDRPERMQGSRYGFVGIDQAEQLSFGQFELANACAGQLGMPWHQTLLAVNPATPSHWAYRRYSPDKGSGPRLVTAKQIPARVVRVGKEDLWDIMPASYRARLEGLSGVRKRQLVDGEWCAHEGLVYGGVWDAQRMAGVEPPDSWLPWNESRDGSWFVPPPDWTRIRGIDFGFDHPAVCLWLALEPGSDRLWLYRQTYMSQRSPRTNAIAIRELEARELKQLRAHVVDEPQARALEPYLAALNVTESWSDHDRGERETYAEEGVWSAPADKDIVAGIGTVADLMARGRFVTVRGNLVEKDERLAGYELPTCLEEELALYHRPTGDAEDGGLSTKETPVKEHDHACDALRYVVQSRAGVGEVRVYG